MSIIRFMDPPFFRPGLSDFERMRREMDKLMQRKDYNTPFSVGTPVFPPLNIYEDNNNIYVKAEAAGVEADKINISVEGDNLTISGEREQQGKDMSYHRQEIETGKFSRAVTLPTKINIDAVTARFKNGILAITLPKAEEVKPKKIEVTIN